MACRRSQLIPPRPPSAAFAEMDWPNACHCSIWQRCARRPKGGGHRDPDGSRSAPQSRVLDNNFSCPCRDLLPHACPNPALKRRAIGNSPLRGHLLYCPARLARHAVIDEHPFCGEIRREGARIRSSIAPRDCPSSFDLRYCGGFFFPNSPPNPPKGLVLPPCVRPLS